LHVLPYNYGLIKRTTYNNNNNNNNNKMMKKKQMCYFMSEFYQQAISPVASRESQATQPLQLLRVTALNDITGIVGNCTHFAKSAFHYMTGYIPLVYGIYLDVTSGYMHTAFQIKL